MNKVSAHLERVKKEVPLRAQRIRGHPLLFLL